MTTAPLRPSFEDGPEPWQLNAMGDRIFLSKNKLNDLSFVPVVGMEVEVLYNKFGKVSTIRLIADAGSDDLDL